MQGTQAAHPPPRGLRDEHELPRKAVTLLVGAPGSGKGTIGVEIARQMGCSKTFAMSDVLRQRPNSALEASVPPAPGDSLTSSASLVGDALACSAFAELINNPSSDASSSIMVDGFPRSQVQADFVMRLAAPTATCQAWQSPTASSPPPSHHFTDASTGRTTPCMQSVTGGSRTEAPSANCGNDAPAPAAAPAAPWAACSALGLRGAVDVTVVILHVSEETSVARQRRRAEAALAHNAQVAASGCGEYMPVRETDTCEALCRARYAVYAAALPHVLRLAHALPSVHIDANGPLARTRALGRAATAEHRAARRARCIRQEFMSDRGGG